MTCDDFRAIAISPIQSKVFEYSFLDRFGKYLGSATANQFGFKKWYGIGVQFMLVGKIPGQKILKLTLVYVKVRFFLRYFLRCI